MWEYNYARDELYHHGILGMKWGVRRYQNKDGSLTNAGKKRYSNSGEEYDTKYDSQYVARYGQKGADRIKKRMTEKGYSRKRAVRTEFGRQTAIGLLATAAFNVTAYSIASGKAKATISKGKQAATAFLDSRTKAYMLDKSGNIIKRYWKSPVKDVGQAVTDLVRR